LPVATTKTKTPTTTIIYFSHHILNSKYISYLLDPNNFLINPITGLQNKEPRKICGPHRDKKIGHISNFMTYAGHLVLLRFQ
jgi:hypothetical protein